MFIKPHFHLHFSYFLNFVSKYPKSTSKHLQQNPAEFPRKFCSFSLSNASFASIASIFSGFIKPKSLTSCITLKSATLGRFLIKNSIFHNLTPLEGHLPDTLPEGFNYMLQYQLFSFFVAFPKCRFYRFLNLLSIVTIENHPKSILLGYCMFCLFCLRFCNLNT